MTARLDSVVGAGLAVLFPAQCALCHDELDSHGSRPQLCEDCRGQLLISPGFRCPRCAGSTPVPLAAGQRCAHCRTSRLRFGQTVAIGRYQHKLKQAVLAMKQPHSTGLALAMTQLLWDARATEIVALAADCIVPIPMHWWRRFRRGVNSPELMAEVLAGRLRVPACRLLTRQDRPPQGSLSPARRRVNLRGVMKARSQRQLAGRRIIVVDDVLTTGATCSEAARALLAAGASEVMAVVLARGEGDD